MATLSGTNTMGIACDPEGKRNIYSLQEYVSATFGNNSGRSGSFQEPWCRKVMHDSHAYCFYIAGDCPASADDAALYNTGALYIRDDVTEYTVGYYTQNDQGERTFKEAFKFEYEAFVDMNSQSKFDKIDPEFMAWAGSLQ